ncbi:MAG: twin-arginine translocation signal domain-containing protein [Candidatus Competibacteraceae bacterium]|nr:twin-arginine translocation signal domain-containing protein [Candidatus Competibacteraceae bacterium]
MNRRDFFKRAAAVVSAAALGKVAPAAPSLSNNNMTITISNELAPMVSNSFFDLGVQSTKGLALPTSNIWRMSLFPSFHSNSNADATPTDAELPYYYE